MNRMRARYFSLAGIAVIASLPAVALAQVQTDGSLGPARTLSGPAMTVTPDLGQQRGGNLFHSFSRLNVNTGESLTFTGPASVSNVLARVTGGQVSNINGVLGCDIPSANLYLINPAGILWGPGAQLNISGSLVLTSSDMIKLADGGQFAATPGSDDVLTSAPVVAFGFLGPSSVANGIGVIGNAASAEFANVTVAPGKTLSLIGGPIGIAVGTLRSEGGRINVVAAGEGAEVAGDGIDPQVEPVVNGSRSDVLATVFSVIQTDGPATGEAPNGPISIIGNSVEFNVNTNVNAFNSSSEGGDDLHVDASATLSILSNTRVQSGAFGAGKGADIILDAGRININDPDQDVAFTTAAAFSFTPQTLSGAIIVNTDLLEMSGLRSQIAVGGGPSPGIEINAGAVHMVDGASISSQPTDSPQVGDVTLNVNSLKLSGNSRIFCAATLAPATGGTVRINATDDVTIGGNSLIFGNILTPGSDEGGVRIQARRFVARQLATLNAETFDFGGAGPIVIRAAEVNMSGGSSIRSSTASAEDAGRIDIRARRIILDSRGGTPDPDGSADGIAEVSLRTSTGSLLFNDGSSTPGGGAGGTLRLIASESILLGGEATVDASTSPGGGPGGLVVAQAPLIRITGGSILSAANVGNTADSVAGAVHLKADRIEMSGDGSGIRTVTTVAPALPNAGPGGRGGDTIITARELVMGDLAAVTASTRAAGDGGSVAVSADSVDLSGGAVISSSTRSDEIGTATGNGGSVRLTGNSLSITDPDTRIVAESVTTGSAGFIALDFDSIEIDGGDMPADSDLQPAGVSGRTTASGAGGSVQIVIGDTLTLRNFSAVTAQSTSTQADAGDAGVISISSGNQVQLLDGAQIAAQSAASNAGDITIDAGRMLTIQDNRPGAVPPTAQSALDDTFTGPRITARAAGDGGNINIIASDQVFLRRALITAQTGATGGQISIDPDVVVIDKSLIDGRSSGTPVPVSIVTDGLLLSNDSLILTDAPGFTVNNDIAGTITAIDARIADATQRLIESCAQRYTGGLDSPSGEGTFSSFIVEGRGGVPIVPGAALPIVMPSEAPATQPAP